MDAHSDNAPYDELARLAGEKGMPKSETAFQQRLDWVETFTIALSETTIRELVLLLREARAAEMAYELFWACAPSYLYNTPLAAHVEEEPSYSLEGLAKDLAQVAIEAKDPGVAVLFRNEITDIKDETELKQKLIQVVADNDDEELGWTRYCFTTIMDLTDEERKILEKGLPEGYVLVHDSR